jgi:TolB protein
MTGIRVRLLLGLALLGTLVPARAEAQRRRVLSQIDVPHDYYYREMYLPQATSGQSSPSFSPDGRTLVFSWQGSLWKQDLDRVEAVQLTAGPGYDYQPDWSPDGRSIVYASYRNDAVELWLLDTKTLESRPLTRNGAVNVEPRFSPDGSRIVFVSTADKGRFHVHVLGLAEGASPLRLTEDHRSTLARYYYSPFDHELSPSWSPDGEEILFVSNRGHIWGTGGFWRMRAKRGSPAREIRYEETNWKARPDWARKGGRVVYASYLGRAWHQIWLMTEEGGDPFPLTYGDFDCVEPRFSPDGTTIAYTSNEGGIPTLWTLTLPGGERRRIEARSRRFLHKTGRLRVIVRDGAGPVPARLSILGEDGRSFAPDESWRSADDGFDRSERPMEYGYFHTHGASTLTLPAGPYRVEAIRGLEYRPARERVVIEPDQEKELVLSLERLEDLPSRGWWSGDLHVHMNYGGAYRNDPAHLAFQAQAEDLHVVESLIVNKEQRIPDEPSFERGRPDAASSPGTLIVHGQEYHTSYWGHLGLVGLKDHLLIPGYAAYAGTPARSPFPPNAVVLGLARAQGALTGYVHPFDSYPDPAKTDTPLTHELPVDVALGLVDYYEVVGFSDHLSTARVWYQLLNCGFRLPAGAGTDAMANFASLRGPVGMNRVFVKTGDFPDHEGWLQAIREGRTFVTNGPLLGFSLGGREAGETLSLSPGEKSLEARIRLRSIVPVDHLEVVSEGAVVLDVPLKGEKTEADVAVTLPVRHSGWYTLRAWSDSARHPVLDIYPFATTSPIYVSLGREKVRSATDTRYFLAWISRLEEAVSAHPDFEGPEERETVLRLFRDAKRVFEEHARP